MLNNQLQIPEWKLLLVTERWRDRYVTQKDQLTQAVIKEGRGFAESEAAILGGLGTLLACAEELERVVRDQSEPESRDHSEAGTRQVVFSASD